MNDKIINRLISLLVLIVVFFIGFFLGDYNNLTQCPSIECNCNTQEVRTPEIEFTCPEQETLTIYEPCQQSSFKKILTNLRDEKRYKPNEYDCTEFSQEASRRLNDEGWNTQTILVQTDCSDKIFNNTTCKQFNGKHDIIKVNSPLYIDPTITQDVISPLDYEAYGIR